MPRATLVQIEPGDLFGNVTILRRSPGPEKAERYRIIYNCCGVPGELHRSTIMDREAKGTRLCPACNRKRTVELKFNRRVSGYKPKTGHRPVREGDTRKQPQLATATLPKGVTLPDWEVPPSLVGKRFYSAQ